MNIFELKQSGKSYAEIGRMLGVTGQRVQQLIAQGLEAPVSEPCPKCGKSNGPLHRHHVDYISNTVENLCASCHSKHTHSEERTKRLSDVSKWIGDRKFILGFEFEELKRCLRINHKKLAKILKELSVKQVPYKEMHPWVFVDWRFPNKTISEIWGIKWEAVKFYRCHTKQKPPEFKYDRLVPDSERDSEKERFFTVRDRVENQRRFILEKRK